MIAADERVGVVDWDRYAWGDPAFDVGYYIAYLETHLDPPMARSWIVAFRAGYATQGNEAVFERVPFYLTFNSLRRACRRFRLQDENWREGLDRMLARVDRQRRELAHL